MGKSKIKSVVVHTVPTTDYCDRMDRLNQLHIQFIKRRLEESGLTAFEQVSIIEKIIANIGAE